MRVCDLIDQEHDLIVATWSAGLREPASPALVAHVPELLRALSDWVRGCEPANELGFDTTRVEHAMEQLERDMGPWKVLDEYRILRAVVVDRVMRRHVADIRGLVRFESAMDQVVAVAVGRCSRRADAERSPDGHAPDHLLPIDEPPPVAEGADRPLDDARPLEDFLAELLERVVNTSAIVDTAGILLREEDPLHRAGRLRVAASIGLEDEACRWYTVPVGTGFSGTVAATRTPLLLTDAAHSPLVVSEWVHRRGIRAIYGVPLVSNDELLGVAHMGSLVATDFPDREKRGLEAAAGRAASATYRKLHG
jgi:hypothetical protein